MPDVPLGAEQTLLLARERCEQNTALRRRQSARPEVISHLDQQRDVGCVVQCTVIELVPIHGRAETVSVEMGRHYNVLVPGVGIHAGQHCEYIWRADVALTLVNMQL